ncbi:hypothetical protein BVG19_g1599 [[Candida] boidinii]|nr:hypothetical protein BVG19_g1599 [[Candida] boidinii]OWB49902.1 hypothetical protein B5S27_g1447 [[Candida] boidinii]
MVVHNPNNWHWVDKNCFDWAKQYFNENLINLKFTDNVKGAKISVITKSIKELTGDVEVCQRKGKIISLFDLKLSINFESFVSNDNGNEGEAEIYKGLINIPEIAYDTEIDEFQFDVQFLENKSNEDIRILIKNKLIPELRNKLSRFGNDLISIQGSDIQEDESLNNSVLTKQNQQKNDVKVKITEKTTFNKNSSSTKTTANKTTATTATTSGKVNKDELKLESTFIASAEQLYNVLLDPKLVSAWTRASTDIQPIDTSNDENKVFNLFNGNIIYKKLKLVKKNEEIELLWKLKNWSSFANLKINLKQNTNDTKMLIVFKNIPVGEEDIVKQNFEEYYFRSIKLTFGFGSNL